MLRKWSAFVLLLLAMPVLAFAQNTGKLAGIITDAQTGDPLPGATVVLEGTTLGTASDVDGNYFIIGVPVGTYNIQASFVGYQTVTVENVDISSGYTREQNFNLQPGLALDEIVVEYERPLIQKDAIGAPKIVSGEDIQNLPVRGATSVAALQGGVVNNDSSDDLFIRGGREEQVSYYVDGVKVIGGVNSLGVPQQAIQEQEMLIGSIPARYGDAQSGIISITTKSGAGAGGFFGSAEAITSEVLDDFGYNLFSGTFGGPLVPQRLSFFISGQTTLQADASPFAVGAPQLNEATFNMLQQTPQGIRIQDGAGNFDYVPLPRDIQAGTLDQLAAQLNIPAGFGLADTTAANLSTISLPNFLSPDEFSLSNSKDQPNRQYDVTGNLSFTPTQSINIRVGGTYAYSDQEQFSYGRSVFNPNVFYNDEDQTYRAYLTFRQYLSGSTFYQIQADFTDDKTWVYPDAFSRNVEDALFYGDIDHPANALLQSYRNLVDTGDTTATGDIIYAYQSRRNDGDTSAGSVDAGTFSLPGQSLATYQQGHNRQFRLSANATTQIGLHQIEFGGEYEQRTQRFFNLNGSSLAQYFADENVEIGEGVTSYADLPYRAFQDAALWYGYDFRGLNEVDGQDIGAFTTAALSGADADYNVEPYSPIYYAGYISDKIEYKDLVLTLGVRVDVFDNNTQVLRDELALSPIIRVNDLQGVSVPSNIGSDYSVYFSGDDIVGYRDARSFFDADGNEISNSDLVALGGRQQAKPGTSQFTPEIFTDYEPQTTFMPRIGVSFPVTDRALFFASYNVTSQRPSERAFTPFTSYEAITGQSRVSNPALKPETTTQYEIGFRQSIGSRAALQLSGFYRKQEDLIQVRDIPEAFPSGYSSYRNVDFATTKGAEVEFDLRRTNNVSVRANYTLSFAQGTGSDAASLGVIAWRSSLGGFSPNFISPTAFDRRHSINLTVDYRLGEGEGPEIGGAYPLANFGINLIGSLGSGMPYTALLYDSDRPFDVNDSFTSNVEGSINGERLPWTTLLNLRVDRRFSLGGASLTAFLWVQNLLNTDNALGVYRATGQVNTDGYLSSQEGQRSVSAAGVNDPIGSDAFAFYYNTYVDSPIGLGGNHYSGGSRYSLPRRTRLGIRLNF